MKKIMAFLTLIFVALFIVSCKKEKIADATFSGIEDVTIGVGQEYAKLTGITATDYDGTDLTDKIITEGILNVNKAGEYIITYKVTGKSGNEVVATRKITVINNARIEGTQSVWVLVGSEYDPLEGVTATDYDGTDLTDEIVVSGDYDINKPGEYIITYSVTGISKLKVSVEITLTVYEISDAKIIFPNDTDIVEVARTFGFDYLAGVKATDYDGTDLTDSLIVESEKIVDGVFDTEEAGTFIITYKVVGQNGVEVVRERTIKVIDTYIEIDGHRFPVDPANINPTYYAKNNISIITGDLSTAVTKYNVISLVDKNGQIILTRDCYNEQIDITHPIKFGNPNELQGKPNNTDEEGNVLWNQSSNQFKDLTIPEGGFAIIFFMDEEKIDHRARTFGLLHARKFGAKVKINGFEIPGFNPDPNNAEFLGVEDVNLRLDEEFDPLAGVKAQEIDGTELEFAIVYNDVDTTKYGWYSVVYSTTGSNGNTIYVTRRVTVLGNAEFINLEDKTISKDLPFDPLEGVEAKDFDGTDLTDAIEVVENNVDVHQEGTYTVTYRVTGKNGVTVEKTITVTVKLASAQIIGPKDKKIIIGEEFDPLAGVSAIDYDGSDITDRIEVESSNIIDGIFDTSTPGIYTITYRVVNANDIETTVVIEVTVYIPDAQIIGVNDVIINIGDEFDPLDGISAVDYDGTDLTNEIVIEGDYDINEDGVYVIVYKVIGASGNEVTIERTITVSDEPTTPTIEINGHRFEIDVDNAINPQFLQPNKINIITKDSPREIPIVNYSVVAIVDGEGKIILVRDYKNEQMDENNPFPQNTPNNENWSVTNMIPDITHDDIPEGGYILIFNYNKNGANHEAREFGFNYARQYGLHVTLYHVNLYN